MRNCFQQSNRLQTKQNLEFQNSVVGAHPARSRFVRSLGSIMGWFMDQINRFICWTNRQPILQVSGGASWLAWRLPRSWKYWQWPACENFERCGQAR